MKKTLLAVMAVLGLSSAFAQSLEMDIRRKIERLGQAGDDRAIARLSRAEKDELNDYMSRALRVLRDDGRDGLPDDRRNDRPGPGPMNGGDWRRNASWARNDIVAYSDASCRNVVTEFRANDDCGRLSAVYTSNYVASVSINGHCSSVTFQTFRNACPNIVNLAREQKPRSAELTVFADTNCGSKVAEMDMGTQCGALTGVLNNKYVSSVLIAGGRCQSITFRAFNETSCTALQDAVLATYESDGRRRRSETIEMYSDTTCRTPVASVERGTNCNALNTIYGNKYVSSIMFRGRCVAQPFKSFLSACNDLSNL